MHLLETERVGLGGLIFQDNTDPTSNMGAMFTYAYHLDLPKMMSKLSLGISGLVYQYKLDQGALEFQNPDMEFEEEYIQKLFLTLLSGHTFMANNIT